MYNRHSKVVIWRITKTRDFNKNISTSSGVLLLCKKSWKELGDPSQSPSATALPKGSRDVEGAVPYEIGALNAVGADDHGRPL